MNKINLNNNNINLNNIDNLDNITNKNINLIVNKVVDNYVVSKDSNSNFLSKRTFSMDSIDLDFC